MKLTDIINICLDVSKEVDGIMSFRRADAYYDLTDRAIDRIEVLCDLESEALPIIDRYLLFVKDSFSSLHPAEKLAFYIMREIKHRHQPICFIDEGLKHANKTLG